jgi:hypothetical protein
MSSLDEVFSDEPVEVEEQVEAVEETEVEAVEDTEEAVEEEKVEETTSSKEEDIEKQDWTLAAVKDERRKRQELEKELESLKQKQQEPKELPDVFDDQKAFVESIRSEFQQELGNAKLEVARSMMMEFHDDYEAMEAKFIDLAKENPTLRDQAMKEANPAKFAYQQAKKYEEYQKVQDVDAYKEQLRNEMRAEIEAEIKGTQQVKAKKASNLTPSLANARASDKEVHNSVTLDDLFAR